MPLRFLLAPSIGVARARARAELLESALAGELGEPIAIELADSYQTLEREVREGTAELVWAPPAVVARVEPTAQAIFKCVRSGHASYRSALIVRRGEGVSITSGEAMRAAWTDPMSMGGYLLAIDHLKSMGVAIERLIGSQRFVGSYPDALNELIEEKADISAIGVHSDASDHVAEAIARFAGRVHAARLEPIAVTREMPTDALVVSDALDPDKTRKLAGRLVPSEPARAPAGICLALEVEGFTRAVPGEYEPVRDLLASIGG